MFDELDERLRSLLGQHVDSYEKLDVVLFVRRRAEPVHLRDLARGLRLAFRDVELVVRALCASGVLVRAADECVCVPAHEAMRRVLDALAEAYHAHPLAVVSSLSQQAVARVRSSAQRVRDSRVTRRRRRHTGAR